MILGTSCESRLCGNSVQAITIDVKTRQLCVHDLASGTTGTVNEVQPPAVGTLGHAIWVNRWVECCPTFCPSILPK